MNREELMWEAVEAEHGELSQREAFVTLTAMEWADKTISEKIYAWLEEHWNDYFTEDNDFNGWNMIKDLRKTIEE